MPHAWPKACLRHWNGLAHSTAPDRSPPFFHRKSSPNPSQLFILIFWFLFVLVALKFPPKSFPRWSQIFLLSISCCYYSPTFLNAKELQWNMEIFEHMCVFQWFSTCSNFQLHNIHVLLVIQLGFMCASKSTEIACNTNTKIISHSLSLSVSMCTWFFEPFGHHLDAIWVSFGRHLDVPKTLTCFVLLPRRSFKVNYRDKQLPHEPSYQHQRGMHPNFAQHSDITILSPAGI